MNLKMTTTQGSQGREEETDCDLEEGKAADAERRQEKLDILYAVHERPPVLLLLILALQQFLTMFGATFSFPILMARFLCMEGDTVGISQLISTVIFVAGLSTIIQTTFGIRLPIIQSVSYGFITPFIVLLSLPEWTCTQCVKEPVGPVVSPNDTNITCGSDAHVEMWQARLRELQGALLISSLFQVVVGFTGLVGALLNLIGPLTIAPTIAMIGLSLFEVAAEKSQGQWWISLTTLALVALFSQYMRDISIPFCQYRPESGWARSSLRIFELFPVLLAIGVAWLLCYIFTVTDVFPATSQEWGYLARTDVQSDVISKAPWFRFPYPGQWGVPTVSVAGVLASLSAIIASIVESVGDYYACARLSGAPPPPESAVNRGIGVEGITCVLAGAWGAGGGTTSYSENIGAIGITKVGSRSVIQMSGLLMIIMGCVGKFSAIFVTIPEPIVGGLFLAMFGMVTAVGISNLQYVDLNSSRNLFIIGLSLILGLSVPSWLALPANANAIDTGSAVVDNVLTVLCSTHMFVAGVVAFVLDNTIKGTPEERGVSKWRQVEQSSDEEGEINRVYDLPWIQPYLNKLQCTKYIPVCPGFRGCTRGRAATQTNGQATSSGQHNQSFEADGHLNGPFSGDSNSGLETNNHLSVSISDELDSDFKANNSHQVRGTTEEKVNGNDTLHVGAISTRF